jgi:hypothetical protein
VVLPKCCASLPEGYTTASQRWSTTPKGDDPNLALPAVLVETFNDQPIEYAKCILEIDLGLGDIGCVLASVPLERDPSMHRL